MTFEKWEKDLPLSASSKVFMKKSRMSDIRLVKQKKVSASANSVKKSINVSQLCLLVFTYSMMHTYIVWYYHLKKNWMSLKEKHNLPRHSLFGSEAKT